MSRFHVHITVSDLQHGVDFYTALLGQAPSRQESDYAKWELDEPRLNFAISARGHEPGMNHLGWQAENAAELEEITLRMAEAGLQMREEAGAECCYARSDKYWTVDPAGIAWESFHTLERTPTFDGAGSQSRACCVPERAGVSE